MTTRHTSLDYYRASFLVATVVFVACTSSTATPYQSNPSRPGCPQDASPTEASAPAPLPSLCASPSVTASDVLQAQLTTETDGWAFTTHHLWVTADAGTTWKDVSPPGFHASSGNSTAFSLDPSTIWVALLPQATSTPATAVGIEVYDTVDGGASWSHTTVDHLATDVTPQFAFADHRHGWLATSGLAATSDGGNSWILMAPPTESLPISTGFRLFYLDPTTGFAAADSQGKGLAVTSNSGRSWSISLLSAPSGDASPAFVASAPQLAGGTVYLAARVLLSPTFADAGVAYYRLEVPNLTWSRLSVGPSVTVQNLQPIVAFVDKRRWLTTWNSRLVGGGLDLQVKASETKDSGQHWSQPFWTGLSGLVRSVRIVSNGVGWMLVNRSGRGSSSDACAQTNALYRTTDYGHTWHRVGPPS